MDMDQHLYGCGVSSSTSVTRASYVLMRGFGVGDNSTTFMYSTATDTAAMATATSAVTATASTAVTATASTAVTATATSAVTATASTAVTATASTAVTATA
eukprot:Lankesteria_metandrocarpae@DN74_c0_g1_i1.p2